MPKAQAGRVAEVVIDATVYPSETLFLRVAAGSAKQGDQTWELSQNSGAGTPIVRLPDGRWVTFSWQALIDAANAAGRQGVGAVLSRRSAR